MRAARLVFLLLLLAWTSLAATALLDPAARTSAAAPWQLRSLTGLAALAGRTLLGAALVALRFAPLGAFAALALPDQAGRLRRVALVALPAAILATLLAGLSLAARAHAVPDRFDLALPGLGVLLGVWAGLAWRRGWRARLLFLPSVAALALAALMLVGAFAVLALEPAPAVPEAQAPSSAEKRQLVATFRGKNPRAIAPGETRMLQLSAEQLDRLASWAALSSGTGLRTTLRLEPGGLVATLSRQLPRTGRWLNLEIGARAAIDRGHLTAEAGVLRIGRFRVPSFVVNALLPLAVASLEGDRDVRRVLAAVHELRFTGQAATLEYARLDMPPGLVARLVWGEEDGAATREVVELQIDHLLRTLEAAPKGDARFGRALQATFALARERSAGSGTAVEENRTALVALGVVLGHEKLARFVGDRLDDERSHRARAVLAGASLRGRNDWVRHFTVSGALTVLSAVAPSNAVGLLKEELDADGGSGFSFGDLLADRSGTRFAETATRDEESAQRMQQRLAAGFAVDDFFPPAADLPEGIPDAELQSRYGGVGGPLYLKTVAELERRLAGCAAYR